MNEENELNKIQNPESRLIKISGMFQDWFLDYASYVILERAVPHLNDGFKPVQRRIIHSMRELEDGRYNKVANIVGNTMKYHPHGDASIGDALVQMGQKDLLIDCQGNWGNTLTGDSAAAPRYIEARLSKFALDVVFNSKITQWQKSYDGRNDEPINFPVKFPLLLAQGVEGIAVGLSTKILPHNFCELIDASIAYLQGKTFELYPDFQTGGSLDVSSYNDGVRGGKIRSRAKIKQLDKQTLIIEEIPFGTTTGSLIESIIRANDKGKIKIKKIEDNTAANVEILIQLAPGISPDTTIDALYAFTDCEVSISPLLCVIQDQKPAFLSVSELLKISSDRTVDLNKQELEFKLSELQEQLHFSTLEKIFIEERIYKLFDNLSYQEAIKLTHQKLLPFEAKFIRKITNEDLEKLLEIRMRRITKHDAEKADTIIAELEKQIGQIQHNLAHIVDYTIDYFKNLKKKYGAGKERKSEIRAFDNIEATKVAVANEKLYVDKANGFIGYGLKKGEGEYVCDCSDIDDIIVFLKNGTFVVQKVQQKAFIGKDIIHAGVWKKRDNRTIYNLIYKDGGSGWSFIKRFAVTAITRDKVYDITSAKKGSEILYFSVNPNGEAEKVYVHLRSNANLRKTRLDIDFAKLAVKGREVKGNLVTKFPVRKVELAQAGVSTLSARGVWLDESVLRLNDQGRGRYLGDFLGDDKVIEITKNGTLKLHNCDFSIHFESDSPVIAKWNRRHAITAVYYDGEKKKHFVKRFLVDANQKPESFISESKGSSLTFVSIDVIPRIQVLYAREKGTDIKPDETINLAEFIAIKGIKAQGNQLSGSKIRSIIPLEPVAVEQEEDDDAQDNFEEVLFDDNENTYSDKDTDSASDTEIDESGQASLF